MMNKINPKTSLVGLIGDPVSHSVSPSMQNAAIQEMGLNWCYLAMPCKAENLLEALLALRNLNFKGLNITIPYKESSLKACSGLTKLANELGAVNTLVANSANKWSGHNTDVEGFISPLKNKDLEGSQVIVLGCGGSARAVVAGLQNLKVGQINVVGRNRSSLNLFTKKLAKRKSKENSCLVNIKGLAPDEKELLEIINHAKLIINTTPVGMTNNSAEGGLLPFGESLWSNLKKETIIYDLIYSPRPSRWLELSQEKGCITIDGLEMLIQQGAASLRIWTGYQDVPISTMRKAAIDYLKK